MGSIDRFINTATAPLDASLWSSLGMPLRPRNWTRQQVSGLLHDLLPDEQDGAQDRPALRRQLTSAFLAGVAEAQDAQMLRPRGTLLAQSVEQARTLMKNRAADQNDRAWHAFLAGARAAGAFDTPAAANEAQEFNLFIRQPFTESGESQQQLVAGVLAMISHHNSQAQPLRYLTGCQAESAETFRQSFEAETGERFTPQAFRAHRLALLSQADAFINIRVGMSESSAFELSYHVFRGACTPVLFLVWKHAPIKTTLLRELDNLCDVTYLEFEHPAELARGIAEFFRRCGR